MLPRHPVLIVPMCADNSPEGSDELRVWRIHDPLVMVFLLAGLLTTTCTAQNVKLKVRVALYDRDLNLKPVPHLTVKLVSIASGTQVVTLQTSFEGVTETELPAGTYHVVTERPVELFDKSYRWEFDTSFTRPDNILELSNDNAKATPIAGSRDARIDELAYQYQRVKNTVVSIETEHNLTASAPRNPQHNQSIPRPLSFPKLSILGIPMRFCASSVRYT